MIPKEIFFAMLDKGALTPGKDDRSFDINFRIVSEEFFPYLEFLVRNSLNSLEEWAYVNDYMEYVIMDDGSLGWQPTGKRHRP